MRDALLATIPDIPRWVELRGALLEGSVTVFGREDACVVVEPNGAANGHVMFIVGVPDRDVLGEEIAIDPSAEVIVVRETLEAIGVQPTIATRVIVHALPEGKDFISPLEDHPTIVLGPSATDRARLRSIPSDLRDEIEEALIRVPVAAALAEGDALASFCYAGAVTETLWDIAIDTLDAYQRQGYAAAAVAKMIELQARENRRPVWQAEETNAASMRLAKKLGFEPVDELFMCRWSSLATRVEMK